MQPLKKRLRPDNIPSEQRVMRGRTGRTIYLLLLSAFALTVLNYLFGDYFLLHADGWYCATSTWSRRPTWRG
jgi:hypothetical protein